MKAIETLKNIFCPKRKDDTFWKKYMEFSSQEMKDNCAYAIKCTKEGRLSKRGLYDCMRHIPIRGKSGDWPEEVYVEADKCLQALFQYAREQKYINKSLSYDRFISFDW
ncbi:MAG: hypothetical protein IJV33_02285 [Bacteroidaceae bacterium]|nr:hypothetical protein [Bacteroidaceae bacterium]